ncbi:thioesterase family protein [Flexibacterium corallicola]|uniref:thioesterase family protein n=1 Tax=Flexibacterium corallicola TaxID=3037259 RepID=UPI00286F1E19|nr:thioesterase family protein [Pseudovibrio sp. M1P-2-3]
MPALETLLSFVNTWECDENDHLNVQFYFSKFEEADRQFRLISGFNDSLAGARRVRHVRYHAELRAAVPVQVRSYVSFDGPHMLSVVHEMLDVSTGSIAATAVDGYTPNPNTAKQLRTRFQEFEDNISEKAAPRGLSSTPYTGKPTAEELLSSGAFITCRATVLPRHTGIDNRADDSFAVGCFSDAAAHAWERTPLNTMWLDENVCGRVAMEQKLSWVSPLKLGDSTYTLTSFLGIQEKTATLRNYMFEARTHRLVTVCDTVALFMNLETRNVVSLDDDAKEAISALQAK